MSSVLAAFLLAAFGAEVRAQAPADWFSGDMHVHRSCGGAPVSVSAIYNAMVAEDLSVVSLLADMGNGEVLDPVTDLPLVGEMDPISTPDHLLRWDAEWHWDATYTQFDYQALGGHLVLLNLTNAYQIWSEYTFPITQWGRDQGAVVGFAHMQYMGGDFPSQLTCCTPLEYPVEVALGGVDFISEDVIGSDYAIQAYYRLLNCGLRPGLAAGSDYPCSASIGDLRTYVQIPGGVLDYGQWANGIADGRTVISRSAGNEFLDFSANGAFMPGDEISISGSGVVTASVTWTSSSTVFGTLEIVWNGRVVAGVETSAGPGAPAVLTTYLPVYQSGWLAARRMSTRGHEVHTGAIYAIVDGEPVRASADDAEFYVGWIDELLTRTASNGVWASFFSETNRPAVHARYAAARAYYQQVAAEAAALTSSHSLWPDTAIPAEFVDPDINPIEVGLKFQSMEDGYVNGVRFFKSPLNEGPHVGHLWTAAGTLLASVVFSNETTSGWQEQLFDTPVAIQSNTTYVVSYHAPEGRYSTSAGYFVNAFTNAPLRTPSSGEAGGNGVFRYGPSAFPDQSFNSKNYWVDVLFSASVLPDVFPPEVLFASPGAGATNVPINAAVDVQFTEQVNPTSLEAGNFVLLDGTNGAVSGSLAYGLAPRTARFTPSALLSLGEVYTGIVRGGTNGVTDLAGNPLAADYEWSFETTPALAATLWPDEVVPGTVSDPETIAIEVGLKFRTDLPGYVTALRFYKSPLNTGVHTGTLWSAAGDELASVVFSNETASGWQQQALPWAVPIGTGTTYVASYFAPNGRYSFDENYFSGSGRSRYPLRALADGEDGGNGVYHAFSRAFPQDTFNGSHYWVDIVFSSTPPNTAPVLPAVPTTWVAEGAPVAITNSAVDADLPTNSLSYVLLGAPTGASIDAGGVITWTPQEADGPGTNTFTTRVRDDGSPPLSDTNSFTVIVTEVNVPPVFAAQPGTVSVVEETLLTVTNGAGDADLPPNTLAYELLAAPAGASIDAGGLIVWAPTEAQGPGTNALVTRVWDDGVPSMSATNSFTVYVLPFTHEPAMLSIHVTNGLVPVSWTSVAGETYLLESIDTLDGSAWNPVAPIVADGGTSTLSDATGSATNRLYRIRHLPD